MNIELNSKQGFIPNMCDVKMVFMLILLVELFSVLLALAPNYQQGFWDRLALISFFAQWTALVNASLLCLLKDWLNKQSVVLCSLLSFSLMMLVTLFFSLLIVYAGELIGFIHQQNQSVIAYFILRNLAISGIIYAVILRYFYMQFQ